MLVVPLLHLVLVVSVVVVVLTIAIVVVVLGQLKSGLHKTRGKHTGTHTNSKPNALKPLATKRKCKHTKPERQ